MNNRLMFLSVTVFLAFAAISSTVFVVDEREYVALFAFGEIQRTDYKPGLHFKLPPPFQNVVRFDRRILGLDGESERFLTLEKKNVQVDFFVKWRIKDVGSYYRATGGNQDQALDRLSAIIRKGLKSEFGKRTIQEAVSGERSKIMRDMTKTANEQVQELGIEIVDVRVQRIDLPDVLANSVYDRMRSERKRLAAEHRAKGAEEAEKIRAEADRARVVIAATAFGNAERVRGEGDAKAAEIYAAAYGKNPEFYAFYRSLDAYKESLRDQSDILVLEPKGEFFQYFNPPAR